KRGSSLSSAGSTILIRQAIRSAVRDPEVGGILLRIDSPGGTVAGTADLADDVAAAAARKPLFAYVEDLTASAAYWIASQAERIYANSTTAVIGSIGTWIGLYDFSANAAKEGIKAIVLKAGKFKGAGFMGTEITDEQKAEWQRLIDKTQAEFTAGVAKGRKIPVARIEELADGRIHMAADAQKLGLIDDIKSIDQTLADLAQRIRDNSLSSKSSQRKQTMSEATNTETIPQTAASPSPQPANYNELKTALPGADAAFICTQLEANATVAQAQTAWMAEQNRRLETAKRETQEAGVAAAAKKSGVEPLGSEQSKNSLAADGDPIAIFTEAVAAKIARGKTRARAVSDVIAENPKLHEDYLVAYNS
ncbi:MAG TPA: S49 family peptidase, partial [Thermoguttaceae bacterium]